MTETKIGYKVLANRIGSSLYSGTGFGDVTRYFKDKKTWRKICNGGLTIFDILENAKLFICQSNHIIYKCKYKPEIHPSAQKLKKEDRRGNIWEFFGIDSLPEGTEYARWIKPLKKISI